MLQRRAPGAAASPGIEAFSSLSNGSYAATLSAAGVRGIVTTPIGNAFDHTDKPITFATALKC
jgi:hypothetical protein